MRQPAVSAAQGCAWRLVPSPPVSACAIERGPRRRSQVVSGAGLTRVGFSFLSMSVAQRLRLKASAAMRTWKSAEDLAAANLGLCDLGGLGQLHFGLFRFGRSNARR